jgi:hypothetical protein
MPPMIAAAQPTPAFTVIAPEAQLRAQAPHSMHAPRSTIWDFRTAEGGFPGIAEGGFPGTAEGGFPCTAEGGFAALIAKTA